MGCTYCFEGDIKSRTGPMSLETAAASLDFVFSATQNAARIARHFGSGEPLMRIDLPPMDRCRSRAAGGCH